MAKKDDNKYLWIILIAVLVGIFFFKEKVNPIDDSLLDYMESDICAGECDASLDNSQPFLQVTFFDVNGNPIDTGNAIQSVVNGVPGVASIGVTARVTNSGSFPLSCYLKSISPTQFDAAMDKATKVVTTPAGVATWSSSAISVAPFEGAGPTTFTVNALCSYNPGTGNINLAEKTGSFILTVTAEGAASFTFTASPTGIPTEWCGDGTCNNGETTVTCPQDCPIIESIQVDIGSTITGAYVLSRPHAQSFVAPTNFKLTKVDIMMRKLIANPPGLITVNLKSDLNGAALSSTTISPPTLSTSNTLIRADLPDYNLVSGTTYYIEVIHDSSNVYIDNDNDVYSGGSPYHYISSAWVPLSGDLIMDIYGITI